MKLLTLNAHSLVGGDLQGRFDALVGFISRERPEVIALQEANQSAFALPVDEGDISSVCFPVKGSPTVPVKKGNFALSLVSHEALTDLGYTLCYLPVKLGYGRLDEGLAVLTSKRITSAKAIQIGKTGNYNDWRRRMALILSLSDGTVISNLHMSRADDPFDPFFDQWERFIASLSDKDRQGQIFLMGDLNAPADETEGGYARALKDGFFDAFTLAKKPVGNATVIGNIDGWNEKSKDGGRRIDYIFSSSPLRGKEVLYRTVLNGTDGDTVSDHFGVLVEIK